MDNDAYRSEKGFTTSDIAEMIGIAEPTVRKYAQALEKAGYRFIKDSFGTRTYIERDAMALRQLKEIRSKTNMPVEQTASVVASKYNNDFDNAIQPIAPGDTVEIALAQQHDKQYGSLVDEVTALRNAVETQSGQIEQLVDMNRALYAALDELSTNNHRLTEIVTTQKAIAAGSENRQEEREKLRDEKLTQVLREIQEAKLQANKSVWKKLFGG